MKTELIRNLMIELEKIYPAPLVIKQIMGQIEVERRIPIISHETQLELMRISIEQPVIGSMSLALLYCLCAEYVPLNALPEKEIYMVNVLSKLTPINNVYSDEIQSLIERISELVGFQLHEHCKKMGSAVLSAVLLKNYYDVPLLRSAASYAQPIMPPVENLATPTPAASNENFVFSSSSGTYDSMGRPASMEPSSYHQIFENGDSFPSSYTSQGGGGGGGGRGSVMDTSLITDEELFAEPFPATQIGNVLSSHPMAYASSDIEHDAYLTTSFSSATNFGNRKLWERDLTPTHIHSSQAHVNSISSYLEEDKDEGDENSDQDKSPDALEGKEEKTSGNRVNSPIEISDDEDDSHAFSRKKPPSTSGGMGLMKFPSHSHKTKPPSYSTDEKDDQDGVINTVRRTTGGFPLNRSKSWLINPFSGLINPPSKTRSKTEVSPRTTKVAENKRLTIEQRYLNSMYPKTGEEKKHLKNQLPKGYFKRFGSGKVFACSIINPSTLSEKTTWKTVDNMHPAFLIDETKKPRELKSDTHPAVAEIKVSQDTLQAQVFKFKSDNAVLKKTQNETIIQYLKTKRHAMIADMLKAEEYVDDAENLKEKLHKLHKEFQQIDKEAKRNLPKISLNLETINLDLEENLQLVLAYYLLEKKRHANQPFELEKLRELRMALELFEPDPVPESKTISCYAFDWEDIKELIEKNDHKALSDLLKDKKTGMELLRKINGFGKVITENNALLVAARYSKSSQTIMFLLKHYWYNPTYDRLIEALNNAKQRKNQIFIDTTLEFAAEHPTPPAVINILFNYSPNHKIVKAIDRAKNARNTCFVTGIQEIQKQLILATHSSSSSTSSADSGRTTERRAATNKDLRPRIMKRNVLPASLSSSSSSLSSLLSSSSSSHVIKKAVSTPPSAEEKAKILWPPIDKKRIQNLRMLNQPELLQLCNAIKIGSLDKIRSILADENKLYLLNLAGHWQGGFSEEDYECTPLMIAVKNCNLEKNRALFELLFEKGADPFVKSIDSGKLVAHPGKSAYDLANSDFPNRIFLDVLQKEIQKRNRKRYESTIPQSEEPVKKRCLDAPPISPPQTTAPASPGVKAHTKVEQIGGSMTTTHSTEILPTQATGQTFSSAVLISNLGVLGQVSITHTITTLSPESTQHVSSKN